MERFQQNLQESSDFPLFNVCVNLKSLCKLSIWFPQIYSGESLQDWTLAEILTLRYYVTCAIIANVFLQVVQQCTL